MYKVTLSRAGIIFTLALFITSCATPKPTKIEVPEFELSDKGKTENVYNLMPKNKVALGEVSDNRLSDILFVREDKEVRFVKEPNSSVKSAIVKSLKKSGVPVSAASPVVLSSSISSWRAEIDGSEITAEAILEVQLDDPSGRKPIYTGRFLGHARLTSPFLSQDDEVDVLRESMQQAIEQIGTDPNLRNAINKFYR